MYKYFNELFGIAVLLGCLMFVLLALKRPRLAWASATLAGVTLVTLARELEKNPFLISRVGLGGWEPNTVRLSVVVVGCIVVATCLGILIVWLLEKAANK
jgi:hypothetical protein